MSQQPAAEILRQYQTLVSGFGLVDVHDRTHVEVSGADRARFLHGFCTNDIIGLQAGQGCEAFLTNAKGRVLGHVLVFCDRQSLALESVPGQTEVITNHLDRYIIREDVALADVSRGLNELLLAGRGAEAALTELSDVPFPADPLEHAACRLAGIEARVRRVPLSTGPSFLVVSAHENETQLRGRLLAAGAVVCNDAALEMLRIEAGFPYYGRDITEENLPQEVNRDRRAISFSKGCYLGQETVARIDALGHVNRLLVRLRWKTPDIPPVGPVLGPDRRPVLRVTSAAWSPGNNAPLSLAYVRREHSQVGTRIETVCGEAEVVQAGDLE
jgi:folate-binding protein YgfZ